MNRKDPAGYYALLGVLETASATEIKSAFRRKAKDLHPDRNPSPDAVRQFQYLSEAYEVLSNPDTRAQYDTLYAQIPESKAASHKQVALEPIACSCCKKVIAQPRYVIFFQVTSFIILTIRTPIQGIFCPKCAESKAIQSTMITWFLGWWGLPWGLIYSVSTIFQNLFGGSKPDEVNARLLAYQAWVFATQNKLELARAIAADAQDFARKIKKKDEREVLNLVEEFLSALDTKTSIKRLKNSWSIPNRAFYIQGSILIAVAALFVGSAAYAPTETNQASSTVSPTQVPDTSSPPRPKPEYVRPTTADNGVPFPSASSYIDGYPIQRTDGYSNVIVDNSQNDSDVFVKLFILDTNPPAPVRVFFIRAREKFKVENIKAGNYDVRYRDLDSGALARTDPFNLREVQTLRGIKFSEVTLTLYKVYGGNMRTYPISENEF
ncbi:MAG: J domain-containing protein [Synechococcales cyanobacterium C42_A2020_086]|nr:J domain-containing protein [Synechococcales cyanobacterium C42_A2020_086]